jgi:hypothetical protein
MIRFCRINLFRGASSRQFATKSEQSESLDVQIDTVAPPEYEELIEEQKRFQEYIKKKQNVSRFSSAYSERKYKEGLPTVIDAPILRNRQYFARLYARHGKEIGVDPAICWPTKDELKTIIEHEQIYDLTLEQKIKILAERKMEEIKALDKLYNDTTKIVDSLPKQIDTYYQRLKKLEKQEEDRSKKNRALMDKVREYYGYELDSKDARAVEMIKKLKENEKALSKKEKKAKMSAGITAKK